MKCTSDWAGLGVEQELYPSLRVSKQVTTTGLSYSLWKMGTLVLTSCVPQMIYDIIQQKMLEVFSKLEPLPMFSKLYITWISVQISFINKYL